MILLPPYSSRAGEDSLSLAMRNRESNVERLLKARAEIDEELRRQKTSLTVLFTDVVGSTAYFDRYGDTAGLAMLDRHSKLVTSAVAEFRGRVIKTIGDSVMAEFPEPALAAHAAVEIQRRQWQLNQSLPEHERIQLRIGINAGVGFHRGNDVYGDAVNVAARITKHTGPAQVLVSHSVQEALGADTELRCNWLGKVTIEGKAEKEDIFEVLWIDTATYTNLREHVTSAFARGELVSPGVNLEDFLQPGGIPSPIPAAEPTPPRPWAEPPTPLSTRYEILGEVGKGGMAVVYKARDRETSELVALKVLKPDIASDAAVLERFKNELRLARKITHRNVCRIHEFNRVDGTAYISMEFVEGESLRSVLNRLEAISPRKATKISTQICAGLREAHQQGVIHRDLKPENVMLDRAGNVKLMDFGIARSLEISKTITDTIVGTPAYMAPEQAEGKAVDHRADIYALGLILYEMITGTAAFSGDTPVAVALKQIREAPRPPHELEPTLTGPLEEVILRCLEKDPAKRFQSVDELEAALLGKPLPEAALTARAEVPLSLARWQRWDSLLLGLALAGLVSYFWLQEDLFPAQRLQVQVDRSAALQAAEQYSEKLKAPHGVLRQAQLVFDSAAWKHHLWTSGRQPAAEEMATLAPLRWLVTFDERSEEAARLTFWISAADGRLLGFQRAAPAEARHLRVAPSPQQVRQQATTILEAVFAVPTEQATTTSEQISREADGWHYAVTVAVRDPRGVQYEVSLSDGVPTSASQSMPLTSQPSARSVVPGAVPSWWRRLNIAVVVSVVLAILAFLRQQVLTNWKATVAAALLFAVAYAYGEQAAAGQEKQPELEAFLKSLALAGLLAFLAIGGITQLARRTLPVALEEFATLRRWRWSLQSLGPVILRGSLLGWLLLGLVVALVAVGTRARLFWLDPTVVGNALPLPSPAALVLAKATVQSIQFALVGALLPLAFGTGVLRRNPWLSSLLAGLWMALIFGGLTTWLEPWPATVLLFFLLGMVSAIALWKFDLLTVGLGVFTFSLWVVGFPSYVLMKHISPYGFVLLFALWVVIPVLGLLGFARPILQRARVRVARGVG